ncbi:pre-mRNA processing factor 3 (PRP3) [Cryptosporidium felis]|nr:pre-mRNA processing factor 3 (PRP3) [Cryptosporidium felis]
MNSCKLKNERNEFTRAEINDNDKIHVSLSTINSEDVILEKVEKVKAIQKKIEDRIFKLKIRKVESDNNINISKLAVKNDESAFIRPGTCSLGDFSYFSGVFKKSELNTDKGNNENFVDSRLITKKKTKKGLRFIRHGALIKEEQELNNAKNSSRKKKRINELFYSNDETIFSQVSIPELEHWDIPFVKRKENWIDNEFPFEILTTKINNLIEHPVPIEPNYDPNINIASTILLTPREKAKLRRRSRLEKEMEKQDRIRMGIEPPPKPKLKMSNLLGYNLRVISEPSTVESTIKNAIEESKQENIDYLQKSDQTRKTNRKARKWELDPNSPIVHAAIFKIGSLDNKRHIFKIDRNAQDCHLTGCCVISSIHPSVIFVEGSKKSIKFYKNLLLNRIKWFEATEKVTDCRLVWEGIQPKKTFSKWKIYYCHSKEDAYAFFLNNNSLDLWNIMQS